MTASPLASSTRITPIHAQPLRIGVFGNPNLTVRLVDLLRRHHLAAQLVGPGRPEPTGSLRRWRQWLLGGRFDLIHGLGCFQYWPAWLAARSLRIATVCEFIGSDVLELQAWPRRRRLWLTAIRTCVDVCMADGRWLAAELARYGLSVAIVNAALPVCIPASPPPLPDRPTVLAYVPAGQLELYGGPVVLGLAAALPNLHFLIVGQAAPNPGSPPNIEWLGHVNDMDLIYRRTTVLIRPTRHDGLAKMVLEALARARQVIWTRPLPGVHQASSFEQFAQHLRRITAQPSLNTRGRDFVARNFDLPHVLGRHQQAYRWALAASRRHTRLWPGRPALTPEHLP